MKPENSLILRCGGNKKMGAPSKLTTLARASPRKRRDKPRDLIGDKANPEDTLKHPV
jgi:hypothetical protein